MPLTYRSRS